MRKGRLIALIGALALLLGGLIYGSLSSVQAECELCVEYNGARVCRRGSGVDEKAAQDAAQRAACAVLATGMAESINCQNRRPQQVTCG